MLVLLQGLAGWWGGAGEVVGDLSTQSRRKRKSGWTCGTLEPLMKGKTTSKITLPKQQKQTRKQNNTKKEERKTPPPPPKKEERRKKATTNGHKWIPHETHPCFTATINKKIKKYQPSFTSTSKKPSILHGHWTFDCQKPSFMTTLMKTTNTNACTHTHTTTTTCSYFSVCLTFSFFFLF